MGLKSTKYMTHQEVQDSSRLLYLVGNKVIDATAILNNHPGGNECLLKYKGQDITTHLRYHSRAAKKTILSYKVAKLHPKLTEIG